MKLPSVSNFALYATIALIPLCYAQSNSTIPNKCCKVSARSVHPFLRQDWCAAQKETCERICTDAPHFFLARWVDHIRGQGVVKENTCNNDTLAYGCKCSTGLYPTMSEPNSIPGQMCRFWFDSCIKIAGNSTAAQFSCIRDRDVNCGKRQAPQGKRQFPTTSTPTPKPAPYYTPTPTPNPGSGSGTPGATPQPEPEPDKSGLSKGALAGIAIGAIAGVGVLGGIAWFCLRRRKKAKTHASWHTDAATSAGYTEKHAGGSKDAAISTGRDLPELQSHSLQAPSTAYAPYQTSEVQQEAGYRNPAELPPSSYGWSVPANTSYQKPAYEYQPTAELQSLPARTEMDANTAPTYVVPPPNHQQQPTQPFQTGPPMEAHELYPTTPATHSLQQQLSQEDITALQEEERRIDAELEEVRRAKELRDQKAAIQQRLRGATGA